MSIKNDSSIEEKKNTTPPPLTALPFVTFNPKTKKFIINEETVNILIKPEKKQIGIVSLGKVSSREIIFIKQSSY